METLLSQIVNSIVRNTPDADMVQIRMTVAGLLSMYDIRPAKFTAGHPDTTEKAKLFLSAKKLEGLSPLTLAGYEIELRIFGSYVQKRVEDISTADIRQFLGQFDTLKLSSISRRLSVLKSFFGWMVEEEIIKMNPTRKIKPPKKEKRLPKALSIEELEMIRESCTTLRERALVEVLYASGGRLSEIQNLNRQDINWQTNSAKVIGKGDKEREIYFSWKAVYHLKKYLNSRGDLVPALFATERKPVRRLSNRGIQREIKIIAARAGITKNVHPHVFQIYAQLSDGRRKEQYQKYLIQ